MSYSRVFLRRNNAYQISIFLLKYGPGLGLVAGVPTIAGGAEYGDEIIDEMVTSSSWSRRQGRFIRGEGRIGHTLRYKREYGAYATVPHFWFPWCGF